MLYFLEGKIFHMAKETKDNDNSIVEEVESKKGNVKQDVVINHQEPKFDYSSTYLENIENSRIEFNKKYKNNNYIKWIVSFVAIAILLFAFFGVPNIVTNSDNNSNNPLQISLMVSLAVISLGIMLGYSIFSKKRINKKSRTYFSELYSNITSYIFDNENYKDVTCDAQRKIEKIQFDENELFKDVFEVGSRATTEFTYLDIPVLLCDCAAQIQTAKRAKPVYVGKYLVSPSNYLNDELIVVYVKGDQRSLPPTNLDKIKCLFDNDKFSIYSNNKQATKIITTKIRNLILKIKKGKSLVDIAISLKQGKCFICLGYDDDLMVLPLEHPFDPRPYEEFKEEVAATMELIQELNK